MDISRVERQSTTWDPERERVEQERKTQAIDGIKHLANARERLEQVYEAFQMMHDSSFILNTETAPDLVEGPMTVTKRIAFGVFLFARRANIEEEMGPQAPIASRPLNRAERALVAAQAEQARLARIFGRKK